MPESPAGPRVAIVDYGMGNLFSVRQACTQAGLNAMITSLPEDVTAADGVILPGVGAMPDAMRTLQRLGMSDALIAFAQSGKPLLGVCLGLQLLMSEGTEFERHHGLGIVAGSVIRFEHPSRDGRQLKVPHVGWNSVRKVAGAGAPSATGDSWAGTPFAALPEGVLMYFVHSFYVVPLEQSVRVAETTYGNTRFCSALARGSVFGCQFHPERSGPAGLRVYRGFANLVRLGLPKRES